VPAVSGRAALPRHTPAAAQDHAWSAGARAGGVADHSDVRASRLLRRLGHTPAAAQDHARSAGAHAGGVADHADVRASRLLLRHASNWSLGQRCFIRLNQNSGRTASGHKGVDGQVNDGCVTAPWVEHEAEHCGQERSSGDSAPKCARYPIDLKLMSERRHGATSRMMD
jgi:hypothetical protein